MFAGFPPLVEAPAVLLVVPALLAGALEEPLASPLDPADSAAALEGSAGLPSALDVPVGLFALPEMPDELEAVVVPVGVPYVPFELEVELAPFAFPVEVVESAGALEPLVVVVEALLLNELEEELPRVWMVPRIMSPSGVPAASTAVAEACGPMWQQKRARPMRYGGSRRLPGWTAACGSGSGMLGYPPKPSLFDAPPAANVRERQRRWSPALGGALDRRARQSKGGRNVDLA